MYGELGPNAIFVLADHLERRRRDAGRQHLAPRERRREIRARKAEKQEREADAHEDRGRIVIGGVEFGLRPRTPNRHDPEEGAPCSSRSPARSPQRVRRRGARRSARPRRYNADRERGRRRSRSRGAAPRSRARCRGRPGERTPRRDTPESAGRPDRLAARAAPRCSAAAPPARGTRAASRRRSPPARRRSARPEQHLPLFPIPRPPSLETPAHRRDPHPASAPPQPASRLAQPRLAPRA